MRSTVVLFVALAAACGDGDVPQGEAQWIDLRTALAGRADAGFARALTVPELQFPRDHGPHDAFRTEWWYWTGNVATASGRRFGFELVFFRQAMQPPKDGERRAASLAADQLVIAHAAVTDVDAGTFHADERVRRRDQVRAGIRGGDELLQLWCDDWEIRARDGGDGLVPARLSAKTADFAFELEVAPGKPIVLQGDRGLSQKSGEAGNASIYYSATRLPVRGTITVGGARHEVAGAGWCDREWSTSALGAGLVGWDWFSLQFDDDCELMWYRLRDEKGREGTHSQGLFVRSSGSTERLLMGNVEASPRGTFRARDGRAEYPASWRLQSAALQLDIEVVPLVVDQELHTMVRYWEGAVAVRGTRAGRAVSGHGYLEMTGYVR